MSTDDKFAEFSSTPWQILTFTFIAIRMIAALAVTILICIRRHYSNLPWLAKFYVIAYVFHAFTFMIFIICWAFTHEIATIFLLYFLVQIWNLTHWLFTAQYVRVACLFQLLFS